MLYVLDEPSIGLHQRDNAQLIGTLERLRDLGNTVLVVEHDEQTMRAADYLVDIGPGAGEHGGQVVAQGTAAEVEAVAESLTGQYLAGKRVDRRCRRSGAAEHGWVEIVGARQNNLKNIDVEIPLGVADVRHRRLGLGQAHARQRHPLQGGRPARCTARGRDRAAHTTASRGSSSSTRSSQVDQSPIGRTPRSNPATYTGLFDVIRDLFARRRRRRRAATSRGASPST